MPRRVARRYDHFAKFKSVAILDFFGVKTLLCAALAAGVNLCRFQSRAQFARAAHQIGMNMGFENVRDDDAGVAAPLQCKRRNQLSDQRPPPLLRHRRRRDKKAQRFLQSEWF